jgi:hypothetical protein
VPDAENFYPVNNSALYPDRRGYLGLTAKRRSESGSKQAKNATKSDGINVVDKEPPLYRNTV